MTFLRSASGRAYIFLLILIIGAFSHFKFWNSKPVISWDTTLYYSYLPALFIYDDIKFENPDQKFFDRQFGLEIDDKGNRHIKMTSGLAMLWSPFFFAAHSYALNSDFEADGFSLPYRVAILIANLLYTLLGLWFFRKLLLLFFTEAVTAWTMIIIFTGSNMFYYTLVEPMSHIYSFLLLSLLLLQFFRYLKKPAWQNAVIMGLASGLLVLIRPTNIILLLFPIVVLLFRERKRLKLHISAIVITVLFALLAVSPQILYWHHTTGNLLVYSYGEEGFFFNDPEIFKGLFSYRKGWLVYSPVMIFGLIGLYRLYKKEAALGIAAILTLVAGIYINYSWWCWWYGGSFGSRPMIDFLPIVGFGMAAMITWLLRAKPWVKLPAFGVIFFLCFLSVFMNKQYKSGIIHYDSMSKELFWKQFLIDHYVQGYDEMLDPPDYEAALINQDE